MLKVTLEFPSVDHAIAALAKLTDATPAVKPEGRKGPGRPRKTDPAAPPAAAPQAPAAASAATAPAPAAAPQAPAPAAAATPAAAAATASTSAAAPAAPAAGATPPKAEEALAAIERLFTSKGYDVARDVLSRFGAKRVPELREDQRAEFIATADKVMALTVSPLIGAGKDAKPNPEWPAAFQAVFAPKD